MHARYLMAAVLLATACVTKHPDQPPKSAAESLASIRLSEDFRIEPFATEPDVIDPVEMVFDENGRIYVAEMLDYPDDPPAGKPVRSRIRLIEDTDGDGRIDRARLFADHVLQVSGLMPWKGGLFVTSAPDILYMKDTDGDGAADVREVWYTGFPKVNPEARITNPRLGVDNWVYCSNAGSDGRITSPKFPKQKPVLIRGSDFRFHPVKGLAERSSGPAQYGLTIDDWNNRFISQNTTHLRHAVIPMEYLARAPAFDPGALAHDLYPASRRPAPMFPLTQPQAWRRARTDVRQRRYNENQLNRTEYVGGYITGASGGTLYTGDVFPREYWGNVFTGDVSANLVRRDIVTPDGVTFTARPAQEKVEFLASSDVWFRPAHFANAPDGNLYLLDMYREFIETPESIPEQIKKGMDFWSGDTMGRIYRVAPKQPLRQRELRVNLGSTSTADLVKELQNTNGWHRQTAHRLLLERQDRDAVTPLRTLARESKDAAARVRSLWILEGLAALAADDVLRGMRDEDSRVREHSVKLAENFLGTSREVRDAVLARAKDPDVRVQFQLAFTLGAMIADDRALDTVATLAASHSGDRWFRIAALNSASQRAGDFLKLLSARGSAWQDQGFVEQLSSVIGARHQQEEITRLLTMIPALRQPDAGLRGLARGLRLAGVRGLNIPAAETTFRTLAAKPSEPVTAAIADAARHFQLRTLAKHMAAELSSPQTPPGRRMVAASLVAGGGPDIAIPALRGVLEGAPPPDLQTVCILGLASIEDPRAADTLLASWKSYAPAVRPKVIGALLERRDWTPRLLDAVEKGELEIAAIDVAARARLLEHSDSGVAKRARQLLGTQTGDRAAVVASHRDVLTLTGDPERGKHVFDENCARCHMPRSQGGRVGPDLSGVNNKTKEELLTSILNPSYAIESRYVNYVVTTQDGRMFDGVIVSETPGSLTLRGGTSEEDISVLRGNITEVRASSISLMPDELEKSVNRQALADVIAYLRSGL